jgi:isopenicillin N synthase-like dioxygenase
VSQDEHFPVAVIASDSRLAFPTVKDFDRAWELGIFYLAVPENLDLENARQFGGELLALDSPYRSIQQYGALEGFIALKNNQQNKLALRRHHWDRHYPAEITEFGRQLDRIGMAILREVFRQSGISEPLWPDASGGYSSGQGTAFLNFVHYDTRNPDLGLHPHTDYGFVTILDATTPGLQVEVNGRFEDVPVLPDHFVINFGEALHFITAHSERPVGAVVHRVLSQQSADPIRQSIVYFANPDLDGRLWQYDAKGEVKGSSSVQDFFAILETNLTDDR